MDQVGMQIPAFFPSLSGGDAAGAAGLGLFQPADRTGHSAEQHSNRGGSCAASAAVLGTMVPLLESRPFA